MRQAAHTPESASLTDPCIACRIPHRFAFHPKKSPLARPGWAPVPAHRRRQLPVSPRPMTADLFDNNCNNICGSISSSHGSSSSSSKILDKNAAAVRLLIVSKMVMTMVVVVVVVVVMVMMLTTTTTIMTDDDNGDNDGGTGSPSRARSSRPPSSTPTSRCRHARAQPRAPAATMQSERTCTCPYTHGGVYGPCSGLTSRLRATLCAHE